MLQSDIIIGIRVRFLGENGSGSVPIIPLINTNLQTPYNENWPAIIDLRIPSIHNSGRQQCFHQRKSKAEGGQVVISGYVGEGEGWPGSTPIPSHVRLQASRVAEPRHFKGNVSRDGFGFWWHVWLVLGLNRRRGHFGKFFFSCLKDFLTQKVLMRVTLA